MEIRSMPDGRTLTSESAIAGYYTTSEFYPRVAQERAPTLPYSIIVDDIDWRSASPMRIGEPVHKPGEFVFFPLWKQINAPYPMTLRGTSPVDALMRHWGTCLPDTRLSTPFRCLTDGHVYHTALTEAGREIRVVADPVQSRTVTTR